MDRILFRPSVIGASRVVDLAGAFALFVLLFPVMVLVAAAAYRPGVALIVRRRCRAPIGRGARLFEFNFPDINRRQSQEAGTAPAGLVRFIVFTCRGDQLPQLINVFRGDLSLFPSRRQAAFLID